MEQRTVNNYSGIYSTALYHINDVVYTLSGEISSTPTRTSIEIGPNRHIEDKLGIYINHSFKPSCRIINGCVLAEKEININDEITFNYNINETKMATPFVDTETNVLVSGHN